MQMLTTPPSTRGRTIVVMRCPISWLLVRPRPSLPKVLSGLSGHLGFVPSYSCGGSVGLSPTF